MRPSALPSLLLGLLGLAASARAVDPDFEVCAADFPLTPLEVLIVAADAGAQPLAQLTAEGYPDAAALAAGQSWDFSAVSGADLALSFVPPTSDYSCSVGGACDRVGPGYSDLLYVEQDLASGDRTVNALAYNGSDTVLLRAQVLDEGLGSEIRVCYRSADVAFIRFPRPGNCAGFGDPNWNTPMDCMRDVSQDDPCGSGGPAGGIDGSLRGSVLRAGTLTLPSGHVVDSLLTAIYVDFDIRADVIVDCAFSAQTQRLYLLVWLVPHYGPIAQISSPEGVSDLSWQTSSATSIGFGLLPPLEVQLSVAGDTSIDVSWLPGNDTRFVEEWVVHWGTEPGSVVAPPESSELRGDTIPVGQTSYTITGLDPGTTYYVSVTSKTSWPDPVDGSIVYRSLQLPDSIGADIDGDGTRDTSYPPEQSATTSGAGALPNLLRGVLADLAMPVGDVLPLDPVSDVYITDFASGGVDTLSDAGPLLFYQLDPPRTLTAVKDPAGVRIGY